MPLHQVTDVIHQFELNEIFSQIFLYRHHIKFDTSLNTSVDEILTRRDTYIFLL